MLGSTFKTHRRELRKKEGRWREFGPFYCRISDSGRIGERSVFARPIVLLSKSSASLAGADERTLELRSSQQAGGNLLGCTRSAHRSFARFGA